MAKRKIKIKDIGLEAKPPEAGCTSESCPWHGRLKVRGRVFTGRVIAAKALKTAIVEWNYYVNIRKYERYERRKTRVAAHNPECISAKAGDTVVIAECRPVSKSKRFVVVEKRGAAV
ncbi:MAG: 30S ribosomal protein S17 [Candidatus Aenigmarchaeota archaeon]|nr:30S ribosomal protein S17 [Candidatus Aenigmarchaeota archaeon]